MKICSIFSVIWEMQIKTTPRYRYKPSKMTQIDYTEYWQVCGAARILITPPADYVK